MPRISGAQRGEGVQAVVFALQILEYLAQHRSTVGVTDLARPRALPVPAVAQADRPSPVLSPEPSPSPVDMAGVWAELHDSAHLHRAYEEELRRKHRADAQAVKTDQHRARPLHHVTPRHD